MATMTAVPPKADGTRLSECGAGVSQNICDRTLPYNLGRGGGGLTAGAAEDYCRLGYRYAKAGSVLTELAPIEKVQRSLLAAIDRDKRARLNTALDEINRRFGRNKLYPAAGIPDRRA